MLLPRRSVVSSKVGSLASCTCNSARRGVPKQGPHVASLSISGRMSEDSVRAGCCNPWKIRSAKVSEPESICNSSRGRLRRMSIEREAPIRFLRGQSRSSYKYVLHYNVRVLLYPKADHSNASKEWWHQSESPTIPCIEGLIWLDPFTLRQCSQLYS